MEPHVARITLDNQELILPRFDGYGLANVAPTVLHLLTGSQDGTTLPPLAPEVLPTHLTDGVRTLVVLIADGLGHLQLQREAEAGNAPTLQSLLRRAQEGDPAVSYQPIPSVFPTTTVAALGALNTAAMPAQHGLLSYTLYLREHDTVAEMIRWGPVIRRGSFSDRRFGGHDPKAFLWTRTLYQRLHAAGVTRTHAVNPYHFSGTALTLMLHQGADYRGYPATSSMAPMVARLVAEADVPTYIYAYWPLVDTVTHLLGPTSEEHGAEVAAFDLALGRLLDRLPRRGDTLLMLTADHGHMGTSEREQVMLNDYPDVLALLAHPPAGERRAPYLYARRGQAERLLDVARAQLGHAASAMSQEEAYACGLFGPDPLSDEARFRIGDVLLFPRGNLQLGYQPDYTGIPEHQRPNPPPPFRGMHGGLSPEEALVPLLALRC